MKPGSNLVPILEAERQGFQFGGEHLSWAEWAERHKALGQALAKRMRGYGGPSTDPDGGDIGGTPVLMRMAA